MITCKEDLINTYIEKGNQQLTKLYLDACEPYIEVYQCRNDKFKDDSHFYFHPSFPHIQSGECDTEKYKRLTLSDLKEIKPKRTKVEYEKVTESVNEIAKSMIDGEVFYNHDGSDKFDWKLNGFGKNGLALTGLNGFDFYRKVEKEIDWRDEVYNKLQSDYHWSTPIAEIINDESDCFLELCRVALRAIGELE